MLCRTASIRGWSAGASDGSTWLEARKWERDMSTGPTETPGGLTEKLGRARTLDEALEMMVVALRPEFSIGWATVRVVDPTTPEVVVLAGLWAARETTLERGMRMSVLATSLLEVSEAGGTV